MRSKQDTVGCLNHPLHQIQPTRPFVDSKHPTSYNEFTPLHFYFLQLLYLRFVCSEEISIQIYNTTLHDSCVLASVHFISVSSS